MSYIAGLTEGQKRAAEAASRARQELATLCWLLRERQGELAPLEAELGRALAEIDRVLEEIRLFLGVDRFERLAARAWPDPSRG